MVSKHERAAARRRNRQRKQQRDPLRYSTTDTPLVVVVDYSQNAADRWVARVKPEGMRAAYAEGDDAHETFHEVLDMIELLVDVTDAPVATIHQLNGSPEAWTRLVLHDGFLACATGASGPHQGITLA